MSLSLSLKRIRLPHPVYRLYEQKLVADLDKSKLPAHVGVILDGNRRWARSFGEPVAAGHQRGADKIVDFLAWSEELGIRVVTLWMLSTDNLSRGPEELDTLLKIIQDAVAALVKIGRWRLRAVGRLDLLPPELAQALVAAQEETKGAGGIEVNVAIGYGGRQEITDAVRGYLTDQQSQGKSLDSVIAELEVDHIADHLYTKGQPDPDLLIRTSGEQRLGGFLLWQSVHSEFYFCEAYWPDFRRIDYLRALREYSTRERRLGK